MDRQLTRMSPVRRRTAGRSWFAAGVLALTACATAACSATTSAISTATTGPAASESAASPGAGGDFAGLVDIGGRRIYVQCRGTGSPTVMLISGNPIAADLWDSPLGAQPTVYDTISKDTRVCAYDRPGTTRAIEGGGLSRSDAVPQPSTPTDSATELHDLLAALGETGPVVLAGHSYGGAVARLFAHTYSDAVSGLVLVDSFTPELRDNFPADLWQAWKAQNTMSEAAIADYPDVERFDFDDAIDILGAGGTIPNIPLVVLTADAPINDAPKPGVPDIGSATQAAHHAAQDQLAALVPGAMHVTETHSGHNMMLDNPAVVSAAIDDVVEAVRAGRSTSDATGVPSPVASELNGIVDIGGGRQVFVECTGTGSPTVLLMAGRGNGAVDWTQAIDDGDPVLTAPGDDVAAGKGRYATSETAVLPQVGRFTRVCAYDRPDVRFDGQGTTPRPQPHTADLDVQDLQALTSAIGEPGPFVLVAHSYSGLVASLFARTYPDEVAGLVMVDAVSPEMADVATDRALRAWDRDNATTSPQVREGVEVLDAFDRIAAAPDLPKVPAVVLVADKPWRTDLIPADVRARDNITFADWQEHARLQAKALGAELVTDTHSGHDIYLYDPALVVSAIRRVVDESRPGAADPVEPDAAFDDPDAAKLASAFEAGFAKSGAAGATAGVWIPGHGSFVSSLGVADRATGAPMTPHMQAPIGSITKTYTVLVALQMVREGLISLDDRVAEWYPDYPQAGRITIRMLANHSSGIPDISTAQIDLKCANPGAQMSPDEVIAMSEAIPREPFAPGAGSRYSSANTILLGRILEKVTGRTYTELITERLFEPLGIEHTRLLDDGALEPPFAHGYTDFCMPHRPAGLDTSTMPLIAFSGGALAATIDDLHTYGVAFGEGYGLDDALRTARIEDSAPGDTASGLGLVVDRDPSTGAVRTIGHAGSVMGYGANLLYYPCTGTVFALMANADFSPAMVDILTELQPVVQEIEASACVSAMQTGPQVRDDDAR